MAKKVYKVHRARFSITSELWIFRFFGFLALRLTDAIMTVHMLDCIPTHVTLRLTKFLEKQVSKKMRYLSKVNEKL